MSRPLSEQQALGLSEIAHGVGIDFIHPRTLGSLRSARLVFQREDWTWGLTDRGHDALAAAMARWPVLLDHTEKCEPTPSAVCAEGGEE